MMSRLWILAKLTDGEPAGRLSEPDQDARIITGAGHADKEMRIDF